MNHRMLRMPEGWEWHLLTDGRAPSDLAAGPRTESALPGTDRPWPGTARIGTDPRAGSEQPQSGLTADETDRPETAPAGQGQPRPDSAAADEMRPETAPAGQSQPRPDSAAADEMRPSPASGTAAAETAGIRTTVAGMPDTEARAAVQTAALTRAAALAAVKRRLPECANWLDHSLERRDALAVSTETPEAGETVFGTLPLRMSPDEHDVCPLHYWLTEKRLVTLQFDLRFMLRLQRPPWEERLERASCAPEAFAVILTAALDALRSGFEAFERRLAELEAAAERSGRPIPVETLAELQRGLLQWNRQLLAVVEAESAAAESFGSRLTDSEPYRRLQRRLSRVRALIGRHAEAIEALTALSGAASMQKSGSLLKALAAVIVLPAPAAAAGALWGMNAGGVPLADKPWGFAAVCGGAALLSLILYGWLRRLTRAGAESGGRGRHARAARSAAARGGSLAGHASAGAERLAGQDGPGAGQAGPAGLVGQAGQTELPSRSSRRKRR